MQCRAEPVHPVPLGFGTEVTVVQYVYECPEHGEVAREDEPRLEPICTVDVDGSPCGEALQSTRVQSNTDEDAA
jgi:hypothetical protein